MGEISFNTGEGLAKLSFNPDKGEFYRDEPRRFRARVTINDGARNGEKLFFLREGKGNVDQGLTHDDGYMDFADWDAMQGGDRPTYWVYWERFGQDSERITVTVLSQTAPSPPPPPPSPAPYIPPPDAKSDAELALMYRNGQISKQSLGAELAKTHGRSYTEADVDAWIATNNAQPAPQPAPITFVTADQGLPDESAYTPLVAPPPTYTPAPEYQPAVEAPPTYEPTTDGVPPTPPERELSSWEKFRAWLRAMNILA